MTKPLPIASNFVVMNAELGAEVVPVTDNFYAELEKTYGDFAGHTLVSCYSFDSDWPTWEVHPKGDEFVILLSGDVEMLLAKDADDESVHLSMPGEFVIVPQGVWHTTKVRTAAKMLFITPGEGTENRELSP